MGTSPAALAAAQRRRHSLRAVADLLARYDRQDAAAPPREPVERLSHLEALVRYQRGQVTLGEVTDDALLAIAAQALAWIEALDAAETTSPTSGTPA